jgi:polyisoprenoid-binding protein YceI
MKKYLAALVLASSMAMPVFATGSYTLDPAATVPTFEIKRLGFSTGSGRFNRSSGKVTLDFVSKTGSVDFTIYSASIDMGLKAWSSHLTDEGLLNIKAFPTMTFQSGKLIFSGDKVVAAEGFFTLLGVTRPLTVAVDDFQCSTNPINKKPMCAGNIRGSLKRSDFGMSKYIPAVSDEISIKVPVEAYED